MGDCSLKFGTSGLRGLASDLMGEGARRYTSAFLAHLEASGRLGAGRVFVGRDFRASSSEIARDCMEAIGAIGLRPIDCGVLPTPALALHAMAQNCPATMVTGSHIPADRNGLKFYAPDGEITKADEAGTIAALDRIDVPPRSDRPVPSSDAALAAYLARYRTLLPPDALAGWRIGVFEHSSVARDILAELLAGFGAEVIRLGRIGGFVAVDTEATDDPVFAPLPGWIHEHRLDAIVSADGDADRPLLVDGAGRFVRGDALGVLTARFVEAEMVVTPVTANAAIEDHFPSVHRTRVGSPYVIEAMAEAANAGARVAGFEANGGFLLGSPVTLNGTYLAPLPTRDAVLPLLAALGMAAAAGDTVAGIVSALRLHTALSGRLPDVPAKRSADLLNRLQSQSFVRRFFADVGRVSRLSSVDGCRFTLESGEIVHFRASGNAPELRCYIEAESDARAAELLALSLAAARKAIQG